MQIFRQLRHNIFLNVFSVLLLILLLMGYTCGPTCADTTAGTSEVNLFVPEKTKVPKRQGGVILNKDVKYFKSPFLVAADGVMVVLAEADYAGESGSANVDIVGKYIEADAADWGKKVTEDNGKNWKTQLVIENEENLDYTSQLKRPIAVAKDNKIYLFVLNYPEDKNRPGPSMSPTDWNFELTVGRVNSTNGIHGGKTIEWQAPLKLSKLTQQFKAQSLRVLPHAFSAFLTEDGTVVFVVRALKGNRDVSVVIHAQDMENEKMLDVSYVESTEECYSPQFLSWERKLIMITTYCPDGSHRVKESADMGRTWADFLGPAARVWHNFQGKKNFITTTIENKTVLLFTELRDAIFSTRPKYEIHLWFSDSHRAHDVGVIVADDDLITSHRLLYTNGELFSLHQEWNNGPGKIILTRLKDQLKAIRSVLKIWTKNDEYLSMPCKETAPRGAPSGTLCNTPMPTDALVGFLSNTTSGSVWQDEYLYMNAVVKGGTKVENGFKFGGSGSGAEWSVFQQYPDQRYNFPMYGLSVVATVTIHEVPQSDTPLLTLGGVWGDERLGLWYGTENQWKAVSKKGRAPAGKWKTNRAYRVALILLQNTVSVYVDGKLVGTPLYIITPWKRSFAIQHLFIGDYVRGRSVKKTASHVTITNVLLYNRPFNETEIGGLRKRLKYSSAGFVPINTVELFVPEKTKVPKRQGGVILNKDVKYFKAPFFVAAGGVMVVLAEADYAGESGSANVDIVGKYIEADAADCGKKVTEDNGKNWKTQLVIENEENLDYTSQLKRPIAVAKDNKIYLFVLNYPEDKNRPGPSMSPTDWNFELTVGRVNSTNGIHGGKTIEWQAPLKLSKLTQQFKAQSLRVLPHALSAFLTEDGTVVFVVRALKGNRDVSVVIHAQDMENEKMLDVSYVESTEECYSPQFLSWERKLIMITTYCPDGSHRVKESADMGRTWADFLGPAARVWHNFQGKKNFITTTIENKTVLLFTELRDAIFSTRPKYEIHLWFSDSHRAHDVGVIVADDDLITSHGLLYTNGELFSLHQEWNNGPGKIILTRLKDQLKAIRSVLKIWTKNDEYLSMPCKETAPRGAPSGTLCNTPMPTDALVGFLSNTTSGSVWQDEYLYMNAVVKGGTKVENGFKFGGSGSGAEWSVFQQYPDQRYNFPMYGLSVVATVTIHEVPQSDTPLLTLGGVWGDERLGLWYGTENQWKAVSKKGRAPAGKWKTNRAYRVALILLQNTVSVYVDGKLVGTPLYIITPWIILPSIQHLFIGDYVRGRSVKKTASHVTITNVLLYNRPFNETEIGTFSIKLKYSFDC